MVITLEVGDDALYCSADLVHGFRAKAIILKEWYLLGAPVGTPPAKASVGLME